MTVPKSFIAALGFFLISHATSGWAADAPGAAASGPARAIKGMKVVIVEKDLRTPGLAVPDKPDDKLVDYKYFDLARVLKERAPLVLAANGLSGDAMVVPASSAGEAVDLTAIPADEIVLLLVIDTVRHARVGFLQRIYVEFNVLLLDKAAAAGRDAVWKGRIGIRLGADEALGVMLTHRVDNDLADTTLAGLLNSLAGKGLIELPQPKAVKPKAA